MNAAETLGNEAIDLQHQVVEDIYGASHVNGRRRATKAEMEIRAEFLISYARAHGPVTVRQLYYQAEVHGLPGIDKNDAGYAKVQRQVLQLRREGRMPYSDIADATRWMRKPTSYDSVQDAIEATARMYRRNLWRDSSDYVEVWCEKDALAGVIYPVTSLYDVPLMVTRGFSSETFCYEAIASQQGDDRPYVVYYLGDFDRAGIDAETSLKEKLIRFGEEIDIEVIFEKLAINSAQVDIYRLPTRGPKRKSAADRKWLFDFACELDAMAPDDLRRLVQRAIEAHLPVDALEVLKQAEASEREMLRMFARERRP